MDGRKTLWALFTVAGIEPDGVGTLLTLEGLIMGVVGKGLLWRALSAADLLELDGFDFEQLLHRAEDQIECAKAQQIRSARRALVNKTSLKR